MKLLIVTTWRYCPSWLTFKLIGGLRGDVHVGSSNKARFKKTIKGRGNDVIQ